MIVNRLVNKNFSNNAKNYNLAGRFQKDAAIDFFKLLLHKKILNIREHKISQNICEIGAGTGFLSQQIVENIEFEKFVISDISTAMLNVCQENISLNENYNILADKIKFENYDFNGDELVGDNFQLIISAMALQWAENLAMSVRNISQMFSEDKFEKYLVFTTLTNNTFVKLHQAFRNCALQYPGPKLLTVEEIKKSCHETFFDVEIQTKNYEVGYKNVFDFLKAIQLTGAGNATDSFYSVKLMRAVVKEFEKLNVDCDMAIADYEVATVICKKLKS